jgi:septum formation protein
MILHEKLKGKRIVLASKSPRRRELLAGLELEFTVESKDVEEIYPEGMPAEEIPVYLAQLKAAPYQGELDESTLVITSDTIVLLNGEVLGKPTDADDAIAMLGKLSGAMHQVITGVCLTSAHKTHSFSTTTNVYFRHLSSEEIAFYVHAYKPFDKAGSYGIQEWIGYAAIERIEGSYFNVMGLPVQRLYQELLAF